MMDVSDGLLIDAQRMAEASGCRFGLMLEAVPLSAALLAVRPDVVDTRLAAATAGDDYQLLFVADPAKAPMIREIADGPDVPVTVVGHAGVRTEERRVGKGGVSTCRIRRSPAN